MQVVAACAGTRFASFITLNKNGDYQKLELTFSGAYTKYVAWSDITDTPELNLTILPKGVAATIVKDGELVVFAIGGDIKHLPDKQVATDMLLSHWNDRVLYTKGGAVWAVSMK